MTRAHSTPNSVRGIAIVGFGLIALAGSVAGGAQAQTPTVNRFTATTASMTPADLDLRIDVREWSDQASRSAVVAALASDSDVQSALAELPTLGYVWRSDSGVGYSVKYAHRVDTPEGARITLVTDRLLGAHDFEPWTVEGGSKGEELDYSVIELDLPDNQTGDGTFSLAADVTLDQESSIVTLEAPDNAPRLLTNAKAEPQPYWAAPARGEGQLSRTSEGAR